MRNGAAVVLVVVMLAVGGPLGCSRASTPQDAPSTPALATATPELTVLPKKAEPVRHIALNSSAADHKRLKDLGYDLVDVGTDPKALDGLPAGMQGLVWVGAENCAGFTLGFEEFTEVVRALAKNPKVWGYYLADEPNPAECPNLPAEIRQRADYIKEQAPGQHRFVALTDWDMRPLTPAKTNVDLVGLDPYPCKGSTTAQKACDLDAIDRMVRQADEAGIPRSSIAPVFQTFGQECSQGERQYWLPTADQLKAMLARWDRLVPRSALDVAYSWGHQDQWACPTLADSAELQKIVKDRNLAR